MNNIPALTILSHKLKNHTVQYFLSHYLDTILRCCLPGSFLCVHSTLLAAVLSLRSGTGGLVLRHTLLLGIEAALYVSGVGAHGCDASLTRLL
jgi:hypothetical protein